jgi:thiamine transport system ATP-binding protein
MINFNDVKYSYQKEQFSFDIDIAQGSIVAVLGASGAGKSTLLNLVAGFIHPIAGDILISGKSVVDVAPHLRPLAILFQAGNLFEHLSVVDNISLGLHPGLKLSEQQHKQVQLIAKQVGVEAFLNRFPQQLSGGQKQRVALARCFVQNRPILLLDEPFSALDPVLREEMLTMVRELSLIHKVTVLMVTHDISDALNIASHFIFIDNGNVESISDIATLTKSHTSKTLQQFVQAGL